MAADTSSLSLPAMNCLCALSPDPEAHFTFVILLRASDGEGGRRGVGFLLLSRNKLVVPKT